MPIIFIIFLALSLTLFVIRKKLQFHRMARDLKLDYLPKGLFSPGRISGRRRGRDIIIDTYPAGMGRNSSLNTLLSISCRNEGIPLFISASFFRKFPDWEHIRTAGKKTEAGCFVKINLSGAPIPLREEQKNPAETLLGQAKIIFEPIDNLIGRGTIRIEKNKVSFNRRGIMTDRLRIARILLLLELLAENVETRPVNR